MLVEMLKKLESPNTATFTHWAGKMMQSLWESFPGPQIVKSVTKTPSNFIPRAILRKVKISTPTVTSHKYLYLEYS